MESYPDMATALARGRPEQEPGAVYRARFDTSWRRRHQPYVQPTVLGAETPPRRSMAAGFAKTVGLFALVALPLGLLISRSRERRQAEVEKAEFRRLGWDWDERYR